MKYRDALPFTQVRLMRRVGISCPPVGLVGTVMPASAPSGDNQLLVAWHDWDKGHTGNCNSILLESACGWWVDASDLEMADGP